MNPEYRQLTRNALLLQLEAASPAPLPIGTLRQGIRIAGIQLEHKGLEKELEYLSSKGFVDKHAATLSAGHQLYTLTAFGLEYLEGEGLA
tara:strand:- start:262 stop:531 length:270 start_codon:yes stop_codon:yes gene_type:complete